LFNIILKNIIFYFINVVEPLKCPDLDQIFYVKSMNLSNCLFDLNVMLR